MDAADSQTNLSQADIEHAKKYGIHIEEQAQDIFYVDPRNKTAWNIFKELDTQWNVGMGGAVGLNGDVVLRYLKECYPSRKKHKKRKKTFKKILLISKGALQAMSDKRDKAKETKP